jgi:ribosomal-protein-alanine N-acetyltransferase
MAFFRLGSERDTAPLVRGEGLYLRPPEMRDYDAWARLREASRTFLVPWEPTWPADDLHRYAFRARIRRYNDEIARDEAYPFLIFRESDDILLGGLTLGQVRRGVAQCATLGYWIGASHARKGYMTRAVLAAATFSFATLRLHRIEAACLPQNTASMRLLKRCGFQREGYARAYLRINGIWQDHVLFARLESDPPAGHV